MWGAFLGGILTKRWARQRAGYAFAALTITLFIFNLRRIAERANRAAEQLNQLERINDIQRQMLEAAARRPRSRNDLLDRLLRGGF